MAAAPNTLAPPLTEPAPPPPSPRKQPMSVAEYLALPDPRVEYTDGEAIFMSPVSLFHAELMLFLLEYATRLVRKHGGKLFPDSVTVRLAPNLARVPDISYVRLNGRAKLQPNHIDGPPDLIIEIVSAESRDRDYRDKYLDYQSAGVSEYIIIDPAYQTIDLHRLDGNLYQKVPLTDGAVTSSILPGFTLRPDWLKQSPLPDPANLP